MTREKKQVHSKIFTLFDFLLTFMLLSLLRKSRLSDIFLVCFVKFHLDLRLSMFLLVSLDDCPNLCHPATFFVYITMTKDLILTKQGINALLSSYIVFI